MLSNTNNKLKLPDGFVDEDICELKNIETPEKQKYNENTLKNSVKSKSVFCFALTERNYTKVFER